MKYVKTNETRLGLHIEFDTTVTANNFKQACQIAIDLAKSECANQNAVAINFVAQDIPIQVVECDDVETQYTIFCRWLCSAHRTKQPASESLLLPGHIRMVKLQEEGRLQKGDVVETLKLDRCEVSYIKTADCICVKNVERAA